MKSFTSVYKNVMSFTIPLFIVVLLYLTSDITFISNAVLDNFEAFAAISSLVAITCLDIILILENYFVSLQDHPLMEYMLAANVTTEYFTDCYIGKAVSIAAILFALIGLGTTTPLFGMLAILLVTLSVAMTVKFSFDVYQSYRTVKLNQPTILM